MTNIVYYVPQKSIFRVNNGISFTDIPTDKSEIKRAAFSSAFEEGYKLEKAVTADFILSHNMYGVDFCTLPNIKRSQLEEAYKAALQSNYKNYKDIIFHKTEVHSDKSSVTFRIVFVRRALIEELKENFAKIGVTIERFIPCSVALAEGASKYESILKKSTSLILTAFDEESYISVYNREVFSGDIHFNLGLNALPDKYLINEKQLLKSESAELLVINANEKAKALKLTSVNDIKENSYKAFSEDEDITELKFNYKEVPVFPEDYLLENFRHFEKRILMLAREISFCKYLRKPENIFIMLPEKYKYMIDTIRKENPEYNWFLISKNLEELLLCGAENCGKESVF